MKGTCNCFDKACNTDLKSKEMTLLFIFKEEKRVRLRDKMLPCDTAISRGCTVL